MLFVFLSCILAGFINGSYAFPVKYMEPKLKKETIWFYFSFLGFLIVPVLAIFLLNYHAFFIIREVPSKYIIALIAGGFIFGIGMVLFTLCLNKIGMGIAFVLNIALGTIGGSLLPLFVLHQEEFFSKFGIVNFIAFLLFLTSVLISTYAVNLRDTGKALKYKQKNTLLGFILGVLSGLFCAMQGFVYAYSIDAFKSTAFMTHISPYFAINVPWIVIFASALIPYAGFQLYLQIKANSFVNLFKVSQIENWKWLILMGLLYFSSLLIYSKAVLNLGSFGQIIAWPLFMIFIILSSNFWSIIQGEWKHSSNKSKIIFLVGIIAIILAIIVLGYAAQIKKP